MAYSPEDVTTYNRWKSLRDHRSEEGCPYCEFDGELENYSIRVEAVNTHASFSYRGCPKCKKAFK